MGTIRLWLSVYRGGANDLWTRELVTDFAPREGDIIHLSVDDDRDSDIDWKIYRHYWNNDGSYECQLQDMIVDPNPNLIPSHHHQLWHTDRDNDPEPVLRRGGWVTYEEWRETQKSPA